MIEYQLDLSPLMDRLNGIVQKMQTFGSQSMPQEMTDWQQQDLNRKQPRTYTPSPVEAWTDIWSRVAMPITGVGKGRRRMVSIRRPILRPQLMDSFHQREITRLDKEVDW